jgi:hypothetical protein
MRRGLMGLTLIAVLLTSQSAALAWDDTGHMIVSYIAYSRLTPTAKARVDKLLIPPPVPPGVKYPDRGFVFYCDRNYDPVMIANWMDDLRDNSLSDPLKDWHHINFNPIFDGIPKRPIEPNKENVLARVNWALMMLESKKNFETTPSKKDDKASAEFLGYLIHLVGDMHQPLHCTTRYSEAHPNGDLGGNLFMIDTPEAKNLHSFWDAAGGLFDFDKVKRPPEGDLEDQQKKIRQYAAVVMKAFPADSNPKWKRTMIPSGWVKESNEDARKYGFSGITDGAKPSDPYITKAQEVASRRLAFAGYRLAELINRIYGKP